MAKNTKPFSAQLAAAVSEAERATSQIADPELRRVAFDRVLEHLLQTGLPGVKKTPEGTKPRGAKEKAAGSSRPGPTAWIRELVEEDFFKEPKTINAIQEVLNERGHILEQSALTAPLAALTQDEKLLLRKKMAVEGGGKLQLHWFNRR